MTKSSSGVLFKRIAPKEGLVLVRCIIMFFDLDLSPDEKITNNNYHPLIPTIIEKQIR